MLTFYRQMQAQNRTAVMCSTLGVFFGTLITPMLIFGVRLHASAQHWPHAATRISSVSKDTESGGSDDYDLVADYDYSVAGMDYSGHATLALGSSDEIDRLLARTPPGTVLDIRYDPKDAGMSLQEQEIHQNGYGLFWLAPVAVVLCIYSLTLVARATRAAA